jgi:pantothenate synthetase
MTAVIQRIGEWNRVAAEMRHDQKLGLVATMGALHKAMVRSALVAWIGS